MPPTCGRIALDTPNYPQKTVTNVAFENEPPCGNLAGFSPKAPVKFAATAWLKITILITSNPIWSSDYADTTIG
jgi:hypothetical protein